MLATYLKNLITLRSEPNNSSLKINKFPLFASIFTEQHFDHIFFTENQTTEGIKYHSQALTIF